MQLIIEIKLTTSTHHRIHRNHLQCVTHPLNERNDQHSDSRSSDHWSIVVLVNSWMMTPRQLFKRWYCYSRDVCQTVRLSVRLSNSYGLVQVHSQLNRGAVFAPVKTLFGDRWNIYLFIKKLIGLIMYVFTKVCILMTYMHLISMCRQNTE